MPLALHHTSFAYTPSRPVLDRASLTIHPARVTALIGPNGSGKSTALLLLAGLRDPHSGRATLDDTPLASIPPARRAARIAWVPQRSTPAFAYSVAQTIALGRAALAPSPAAVARAAHALALTDMLDRPITELSVGQHQRVALARALCQLDLPDDTHPNSSPRYLLADEPTSALDPAHVAAALALFQRLARAGVGVALALHDLTQAAHAADLIAPISDRTIGPPLPPPDALSTARLQSLYGTPFAVPTAPVPVPAGLPHPTAPPGP